jgi:hypothetical protein
MSAATSFANGRNASRVKQTCPGGIPWPGESCGQEKNTGFAHKNRRHSTRGTSKIKPQEFEVLL